MKLIYALIAALAVFGVAYVGVEALGLQALFGIWMPYLALLIFVGGFLFKIWQWARAPVPFAISTTCGQQKTLPWIKPENLENPHNIFGVIGRMFLEVLFFRSLFRNTKVGVTGDGRMVHGPAKWLWAAGLAFHWCFLFIFFRHIRFVSGDSVPWVARFFGGLDGFLQIGVPVVYVTTLVFLGSVTYLFLRRIFVPQVRYLSLMQDYFALLLLLGVGLTGATLRHFIKADVVAIKGLTNSLVTFSFTVPEGIHWLFFAHLLFVCVLAIYFPFSKLMHMPGVFFSPTRNMLANSREFRHVNPWNYPVKTHPYDAYEDDFRERMVEAGIPVEKKV